MSFLDLDIDLELILPKQFSTLVLRSSDCGVVFCSDRALHLGQMFFFLRQQKSYFSVVTPETGTTVVDADKFAPHTTLRLRGELISSGVALNRALGQRRTHLPITPEKGRRGASDPHNSRQCIEFTTL